MTHTAFQRGRRAGERGVPRIVPADVKTSDEALEWLDGYDSCFCGCENANEGEVRKRLESEADTPHPVTRPQHYMSHPSGIECIQITEHMGFCLGNAVKYIWRAGLKTEDRVQDLQKAMWYLEREITRERGE